MPGNGNPYPGHQLCGCAENVLFGSACAGPDATPNIAAARPPDSKAPAISLLTLREMSIADSSCCRTGQHRIADHARNSCVCLARLQLWRDLVDAGFEHCAFARVCHVDAEAVGQRVDNRRRIVQTNLLGPAAMVNGEVATG